MGSVRRRDESARRFPYRCIFALSLSAFLGSLALSCDLFLPETTVVRRINAAWDSAGVGILAVESEYRTRHPEEPHFNATSATDWKLRFVRFAPDLTGRTVVMEWDDVASIGGMPQYGPLYWDETASLAWYTDLNRPFMADLASGKRTRFVPPRALVEPLFAPWPTIRYEDLRYSEAAPSPDGRYVALWLTGYYDAAPAGNPVPDIRNQSSLAIWRVSDRSWIAAIRVPWNDDAIEHFAGQFPDDTPFLSHFVWNKDSSSIFVFHRFKDENPVDGGEDRAWLVTLVDDGIQAELAVSETASVPARVVQTAGGIFSPEGLRLVVVRPDSSDTDLIIEETADWVPFTEIGLVPY